jgi:PAS domain S-box-containing protein
VELIHDYPKALYTGIHLTVDRRGEVLAANTVALDCLGHPGYTLIGRSLFELCHPDDQATAQEDIAALFKHPDHSLNRELCFIRADGSPVRLKVMAQVLQSWEERSILLINAQELPPYSLRTAALATPLSAPQTGLYQIQRLNAELEQQVEERTEELELALKFQATVQLITDRVRGSLDEDQILQTAVKELALALDVNGCNAAVYDLDHRTSTVRYEYTISLALQGRVLQMDNFAVGYNQLLQGQFFQFCSLMPNPDREPGAMIACPIQDDQGVLGDLWLTRHTHHHEEFSDQDIRLVQQVANHCAIALRQARLYQKAQAQVEELEKLNRLKDDFLSTVSHELRTPMTNIKLSTQMLEISLHKSNLLNTPTSGPLEKYLKILHAECKRETTLINDLLDLSRLEAGAEPLVLEPVFLSHWLQRFVEPFVERARNQQQQLQVEVSPSILPVMTDTFYLERLLGELLNNACKYTPKKEKITLTVIQEASAAEAPADGGARFILLVRNSGVEISTSELPRIFDKFYRIPNNDPWKHGGTGLGLTLVKHMVDTLGGTIQVSSGEGATCFRVELPADPTTPGGEDRK